MNLARQHQQKLLSAFVESGKCSCVAAAVSGGIDSVAMLLLLAHYCRMKKVRLCVFHVDHALRPASEEDRRWVADLALKLGLDFYWRRAGEADKTAGVRTGSEAWARNFRYGCFAQMLDESGAEIIATGHTADDQAETVLMRMLRGCGVAGAGGIRARRTIRIEGRSLRLWRPLLKLSRSELQDYLGLVGQDWREDETNVSGIYFRNQVRHHMLPLLQKAAPGAIRHLSELAEELQRLHAIVLRSARIFLGRHMQADRLEVSQVPPAFLRHEVIRLWLVEVGAGESVNRRLIEQIDSLWLKKCGGRKVPCCKMLFCRRGNLIILTQCSE